MGAHALSIVSAILSTLLIPSQAHKPDHNALLTITTTSGPIHGFINSTAPLVRQFLSIPYAEPPLASLRFAPPQSKSPGGPIDATRFGPSCMQQSSNNPTIYTEQVPQFLINGGQSEDCLFLNIWAPVQNTKPLPVFVYISGGGFTSGGLDSLYKIFDKWI
jgi:carboxylesterase type B